MLRAGIGIIAVACLAGCSDARGSIVLETSTEVSEKSLVACLKRQNAIDHVRSFSGGRRSGTTALTLGSSAYALGKGQMLFLFPEDGEPDRIKVRGDRELQKAEQLAIQGCASGTL